MTTFELDESQRAAVSAAATGDHFRIVGAPGSGKTTVVTEIVAALIARDGESAVRILTPSRQAATRLRDLVALRVGIATRGPLARSVSSLAFEIVSAEQGNGFPARLMSGGEQDSDIKALLDGEIADGTDGYWPASLNADVRRLREFRTQLRDLLSRSRDLGLVDESTADPFAALTKLATAAEFGSTGPDVSERQYAAWVAAATFFTTYRRLVARSRAGQVDPAELVDRARVIVGSTASDAPRMALVVDDAHDLTPAQWRFVIAWAKHRGSVIAVGDPDVATTGFRGGQVTFLDDADLTWGSTRALTTIHRQGGVMPSLLGWIASTIGGGIPDIRRTYPGIPEPAVARSLPGFDLLSATAASPAHERDVVARYIRDAVARGTSYGDIAVVVRSGSMAESMVTHLNSMSIPTFSETTGSPLRDHPAVWSLLNLVSIGIGRESMTAGLAQELLLGPFGRLTTLDLRRFRRNLRKAEITAGGNRLADDLMLEALTEPGAFETEVKFAAPGVRWLVETLRALRLVTDRQIDELLWVVWARSDRERAWTTATLGAGPTAVKAHESLDAIMALFAVAATSLDNVPTESADVFLDRILGQTVPNDSLSPRATTGSVLVCTPAATVGREFEVVVVAGLNEGVWPNTRPRSALLKANELALVHAGIDQRTVDYRRDVIFDEVRLFLVAMSRARSRILVTAIQSEDETPSGLFRMVAGEKSAADDFSRAAPALNARGDVFVPESIDASIGDMIGRLRHLLMSSTASPTERSRAASALRALADREVSGAHPDSWIGYRQTTPIELFSGTHVPVSPSNLENFDTSALDWFVSSVAGGASGLSAAIGTLVHRAIEVAPAGTRDDLWAAVEEKWNEVNFDAPWLRAQWLATTRSMIDALADYVRDAALDGRRVIDSEKFTTVTLSTTEKGGLDVVVGGTIDRVEQHSDGSVSIIDIKTAKAPLSAKGAESHLQLKAYQLAFSHKALGDAVAEATSLHSAGLLYPRVANKSSLYTVRTQSTMDAAALDEFTDLVISMGVAMHSERFTGPETAPEYSGVRDLETTWVRISEVSSDE
jgi:superfamily I DNA/RNA helicase/RecB family exonuclease